MTNDVRAAIQTLIDAARGKARIRVRDGETVLGVLELRDGRLVQPAKPEPTPPPIDESDAGDDFGVEMRANGWTASHEPPENPSANLRR